MLAFFPCLLSLAYGNAPIKRERESLEVKSPAVGDTIALAESRYDEISLNISWIAPQATVNWPSSVSLVQGKQPLVPCFTERHDRYTAFLNLPNP